MGGAHGRPAPSHGSRRTSRRGPAIEGDDGASYRAATQRASARNPGEKAPGPTASGIAGHQEPERSHQRHLRMRSARAASVPCACEKPKGRFAMTHEFRLTLLAAALAAVAATNVCAADAQVTLAHAPRLQQGENVVGPLAASQSMHIEVALKLRNQAQLRSFLQAAHSPSLLIAQRTMSSQQFVANHSPTQAQANAV